MAFSFRALPALDFTRRDGNAGFANGDDAVKFTEFDAKGKHIGNPLKNTNQTARTNLQKSKFNAVR